MFKKWFMCCISASLLSCGALSLAGAEPPPPDMKRIADDEARGIRFSDDKKVLVKYGLSDKEYIIPAGVTTIGDEAFSGCENLTRVIIPVGVETIGKKTFAGCTNLTKIAIPSSVTSIGECALYKCTKLRSVILSSGIKTIETRTFAECENLPSVDIPAGVTTIKDEAFSECTNLTSITIPSSVSIIGPNAFANCPCEKLVKKRFPKYAKIQNQRSQQSKSTEKNQENTDKKGEQYHSSPESTDVHDIISENRNKVTKKVTSPFSVTCAYCGGAGGRSYVIGGKGPTPLDPMIKTTSSRSYQLCGFCLGRRRVPVHGRINRLICQKDVLEKIKNGLSANVETFCDFNIGADFKKELVEHPYYTRQKLLISIPNSAGFTMYYRGNHRDSNIKLTVLKQQFGKLTEVQLFCEADIDYSSLLVNVENLKLRILLSTSITFDKTPFSKHGAPLLISDFKSNDKYYFNAQNGKRYTKSPCTYDAIIIKAVHPGIINENYPNIPQEMIDIGEASSAFNEAMKLKNRYPVFAFGLVNFSANHEYADAQYQLGLYYQNGRIVNKDLEQAVYWFRKAAEQGNAKAQNNLGWCYGNGRGVEKDYKQAVYWYHKSAKQGFAPAQYNLGWCYDNGRGVERDFKQAVYWYRRAAEQGHAQAKHMLNKQKGNAAKYRAYSENSDETLYRILNAANLGNAQAQFMLGNCYSKGIGMAQNHQLAVYWYQRAAEQGHADAQGELGACYYMGIGVEKDNEKAIYWLRKSAAQGNAESTHLLGQILRVMGY